MNLSEIQKPSLIVFDLDNTIWTPELYQLRTLQAKQKRHPHNPLVPIANKDVQLFDGVQKVIQDIQSNPTIWKNTQFAIASRTKSIDWAKSLLIQFQIHEFFPYQEIFPGDKKRHFTNLHSNTNIPYNQMLFFDDNRDGKYGNCVPVSELGVLSVHCPNGIDTEDIFLNGLNQYHKWSKENPKQNAIVEWDGSLTYLSSKSKKMQGIIKMINYDKQFGFIKTAKNKDIFFPFRHLPSSHNLSKGDSLSFDIENDPRNEGKTIATNIEIIQQNQSNSTVFPSNDNFITLRAFSMNLPFAALLANGYKTLETRNGTMFVPYPEGTQMLLHVGQRIYPDGNRHLDVMKSAGLSDQSIQEYKSLPPNFGKGMVIAIVEIGQTYETTLKDRCEPQFQQKVGAFGNDSGKMVTEIKRVAYLNQGVKVSGKGGVFKVKIDPNVIPDGWIT